MMREMWRRFRRPVRPETERDLADAWARLDPEFRVPWQTIGQMEEACGATIGAMPVCDFGCKGCYLGGNANATPPLPLDAVKEQMRVLRQRLGVWGNLQLTDGEVTLRPEAELIELLRYARQIELIPMVMTHGETFRRRPGLLERLMAEGGLVEMSVHVDVLQRGRDADYARAKTEAELMPLRAEFAEMFRAARRRTGLPLRVASTCTVTPENLHEVPMLVRWYREHADAFRLISFQPAAQVGRSRPGLGGHVTADDVWEHAAQGILGDDSTPEQRRAWVDQQWWFGHPDCSRVLTGLVGVQPDAPPQYEPVCPRSEAPYADALHRFMKHWGGVSFRSGSRLERTAQLAGMFRQDPGFFFRALPRLAVHLMRKLDPDRPLRLAARLATGRATLHPMTIVTHQFMSRAEIETPRGQERIRNCIFTVPIDGELVAMCEVNALGIRDRVYDRIAGRDPQPHEPLVDLTIDRGATADDLVLQDA
ncbi:MAG: radical SAM protein [Planctomycetota bacterium]